MTVAGAKQAVLALVQSASAAALAAARPLADLRSDAYFNADRDRFLMELQAFQPAFMQIVDVPHFADRFGLSAAERVCLQFVYEYFKRVPEQAFYQATFDEVWSDFVIELEDPMWTTRGVTNVTYFNSDALSIPLGDGVSIRGRNLEELAALGFSASVLDRMREDWWRPGVGSFVLVAEHRWPKEPANLILRDSATPWTKAFRALGALRLIADGDIGIGAMWIARPARFNLVSSGVATVGVSLPNWGRPYTWSPEIARDYPAAYAALAHLERDGYSNGAGNLDLALRSFMATYDRWPGSNDSKLLDAVTSLEAILGAENEISFKLSFRVASLLAANDDERTVLLKVVKSFYDARSKLVHGASLRVKQKDLIARADELRSLLRRLLRAFVALATDVSNGFGHSFFATELDSALVNGATRDRLRKAMGLAAPSNID